jgi:hypothetical protein
MRLPGFLTRRVPPPAEALHMDVISLALGLGAFATFLGLIEGLRRI